MNLFLFHRDLRLTDNTSLIKQVLKHGKITPIFIFPPEQIDPSKNKYFSHNSVQFMIESLRELSQTIKSLSGTLYFFQGGNLDVLQAIHKTHKISSLYFNADYTPYAKKRDVEITQWGLKQGIQVVTEQDYPLYNILDGTNLSPKTKKPYLVFTPFRNFCMKQLSIRTPNPYKFKKGDFETFIEANSLKFHFQEENIGEFYNQNKNIRVHGGRTAALEILQNIIKFKNYNNERNNPNIPTTGLSAHLHFNTVSAREVFHRILKLLGTENNLVNQLHWRDFYMNITHHFPRVLGEKNRSFQSKFDQVDWLYDQQKLQAWKEGRTGFPIVDAAMHELNTTGFMHNRCRMIVASFFSKDLFLDWQEGQRYFASQLVDYSAMQNSGGWQWTVGNGTDSQPYFRIFNPWTQQQTYDPQCQYIKKWLPQLKNVPIQDIHRWSEKYHQHMKRGVKYPKPIIDHDEARKKTLAVYNAKFKSNQK